MVNYSNILNRLLRKG